MKKILFLILPFPSHYTASFSFANEYKKKDFEVVFTGTISQKELIENEGFIFQEFQYTSEYSIKTFKTFLGLWIKNIVDKNFGKSIFKEFISSQLSAQKLYKKLTPEHIFIDEHLAEYYLFFKQYNVKVTILNTKLSTKKVYGIPPLNSDYIPTNTFLSAMYCEFLWAKVFMKHNLQNLLQKIAFGGKDEIFFWKRLCKKNGWNWKEEIATNHVLNRSFKTIPTIILAPEKLEFSQRVTLKNENYFHAPSQRNEEKYMTQEYLELIEKIKLTQQKVIYCSFGTLAGVKTNNVFDFFRILINIATQKTEWIFVVSSSRLKINHFEKQNNLYFLDFIPQIDLLNYTDVMITHGGLGSVKECIDANVPMYVLPLNLLVDQKGNAARVEANNLGLRGVLGKDTEKQVVEKIEHLLKIEFK
jgi:zeaxanthin glucosyltransferase